jgi:phosphatidylglycerophosphate synthase
VAYALGRLRFSPSAVTLLGGLAGVSGAVLLGVAQHVEGLWLAGGLLLLSYTMDCADGQLARATGRSSAMGGWLDVTVDAVVVAVLSTSLAAALARSGRPEMIFLLASAFAAARIAALFTATRVRSSEHGGMRLSGVAGIARTAYASMTDTPFVYVLLCATRLVPVLFEAAIGVVALLSAVRTIVSARHHFRKLALESTD